MGGTPTLPPALLNPRLDKLLEKDRYPDSVQEEEEDREFEPGSEVN
jgi:hypothetical protein